jgi:NADH-quinone oxidoreductase subunit L
MVRLWKIVFFGATRSHAAGEAHEGGIVLTLPLLVLALCAVLAGYRRLYPAGFAGILGAIPEAEGRAHGVVFGVSLAVLLIGALAAWAFYPAADTDALERRFPGLFSGLNALQESFDRLYSWYVAKVQERLAMALNFIDVIAIAGLLVRGAAGLAGLAGLGARALQVGRINAYVYWFLAGVVVLWLFAAGVL